MPWTSTGGDDLGFWGLGFRGLGFLVFWGGEEVFPHNVRMLERLCHSLVPNQPLIYSLQACMVLCSSLLTVTVTVDWDWD